MGRRTDAELVAACRNGQAQAWDELVERFSRYVYAITQAYRLNPQDAEDVFQDVFTRAWERLDTLRSDDALRPWLGQLTRNLCLDRLRFTGREEPTDAIDEEAAADRIEQLDEAFSLRQAMQELSPECQEVLDRFFCRDESYRTIGDELGLPGGTIASRISRCLRKLRGAFVGRSEPVEASSDRVNR